jgi:hypothetical protein
MTHDEIAAQNLTERYVTGKLSPEESAQFEEHFVDCAECLDRLESAERLRDGLRRTGARQAVRPQAPWPQTAWLVAAALILACGVGVWFAVKFRRESEQARLAALQWQHRYEAAQSATAVRQPMTAATFFLSITRDGGSDASAPVNRVTVAPDSIWLALSLEGELDPAYPEFRASLADAGGKVLWHQDGLARVAGAPLTVVVPSGLLRPGDYALTLDGLSAGRYVRTARYTFRAVAR